MFILKTISVVYVGAFSTNHYKAEGSNIPCHEKKITTYF
jgi:hypothetical protein